MRVLSGMASAQSSRPRDGFAVRSRRGWNMTEVLPELRRLPAGLVLDGELVAWKGSEPYFPLVCRRVLNRDMSIPLTFVAFDLLQADAAFELRRSALCGHVDELQGVLEREIRELASGVPSSA